MIGSNDSRHASMTRAGLILLALCVMPGAAVLAQSTAWDATTGDWFNAANWTDGVPDATTSTDINNGGTAQITDPGAVAGGLDVGFDVDGALEITGGGTLASDFGRIASNSEGTVLISGAGSAWTTSGNLSVGPTGAAELTIAAGAVMENQIGSVGGLSGGVGIVTVTGTGSEWINNDRLQVANFGQAELTIAGGALVEVVDVAVIGLNTDASGDVTVTGTDSEFLVDGELTVGSEGEGVLTVGAGTRAEAAGQVLIGDPAGAGGTVMVNGALGGDAIVVAAAGVLGGTGQTGPVEVNGVGTLAPGESAGTLATGDLTLGADAVTELELAAPGTIGGGVNDLVAVDGDLVLDGALDITALSGFGEGTYTVMTYTGALTDNSAEIGGVPDGFTAEVDTGTAGEVNLVVEGLDAELIVDPRDVFFPDTRPGDTAAAAFTLESTGDAELVISQISDPGPHFEFAPGDCGETPITLAPGATCDMEATFAPQFGGDFTRTVELESNAPDSPDFMFLIGNGIVQVVPALGPWALLVLIAGAVVIGFRALAHR